MLIYLVMMICVLLSVAFVTLLERSVLGYVQIRKGPNSIGYLGLFQPFSDAIKLFTKEEEFLLEFNYIMFLLAPGLGLFLMLMFWCCYPWINEMLLSYDMIYIMCISSMGLYVTLFSGWSSNSKYSLIGSYRGVAQTISYEVSFSFVILSLTVVIGGFSLVDFMFFQTEYWFFLGYFMLFLLWLVIMLAEVNRTPFDLVEGESELVSGFNIEYGSGGFALLFMAEYGNIIFMGGLTGIMFMGGSGVMFFYSMLIVLLFLWMRGVLVRFRYDNLMMMAWKVILPFSLFYLILMFMLVMWF